MSNASYHDETDSISTSQFKVFCESPAEYHGMWIAKTIPLKESTGYMNTGTVIHGNLLEKKPIDDLVRAYPTSCLKSNGYLNPVPAAAFREKIQPLIAMTDQDIEQIEKICKSAMNSPLGEILRSGAKFEQRLDAEIEGVKCRCRPDIHTVLEGLPIIWDLKTTERIRPDDWWRTAKMMGYAIQDAMYSLIAESHYGTERSTFRFWAIETVKCLRVQPYWYDEHSREIAKDYVRGKLKEFAIRNETKSWSDNWDSSGVIGPWDFDNTNDDGEMVAWGEDD